MWKWGKKIWTPARMCVKIKGMFLYGWEGLYIRCCKSDRCAEKKIDFKNLELK